MSGLHERWVAALDEIEHHLDVTRAVIDGHEDVEVPAWQPPGDIGPLPEELWPRARALAQELDAATQAAAQTRERIDGELGEVNRRRGAGTAYASTG